MTIGQRIKEIRRAESLTMEKFGEKIGVGKTAISKIESGDRGLTDQMCRSICREFGVNEAWLRTGEGEPRVRLSRNDALEAEIRQALAIEPDSFRERLIHLLLRLDAGQWEALERYALELVGDRLDHEPSRSIEDEARAEAEAYYQEILAEKKTLASSASSTNAAGGDGGYKLA